LRKKRRGSQREAIGVKLRSEKDEPDVEKTPVR
jgi:hypothetical protein